MTSPHGGRALAAAVGDDSRVLAHQQPTPSPISSHRMPFAAAEATMCSRFCGFAMLPVVDRADERALAW